MTTTTHADLRSRSDALARDVASFAALAMLDDDAVTRTMLRSYLIQFLDADADYCSALGLDALAAKQRSRALALKEVKS